MRLQRFGAFPALDYSKCVIAERCLNRPEVRYVDYRLVADASVFRQHRWAVLGEQCQHGVALTGLGSDRGNDVNHPGILLFWFGIDRRLQSWPRSATHAASASQGRSACVSEPHILATGRA